ncbi:MAG: hypothetical protein WBA67_04350, partial [Jannaschia sp.]
MSPAPPPFARRVAIRADGSGQIGLGHILRTMAVADELARTGARTSYLCRTLPPWAATLLRRRGHGLHALDLRPDAPEREDAEQSLAVLEALQPDVILLDHYALGEAWTTQVAAGTGKPLAALDDLASFKRDIGLVVDPTPDRLPGAYADLVPAGALCLTGADFAPLRPEFALARPSDAEPVPTGALTVGVMMGGADPTGLTLPCLDAL